MAHLEHEIMSEAFEKWHIRGIGDNNKALHVFTQPDNGYAHNHPFDFTTHILEGSYIEEVWHISKDTGKYFSVEIERKAGTMHKVHANTIHLITEIPQGKCITLCTYGEWKQQPGFYKFENGKAYYKQWNETDDKFKLIEV